MPVSAAALLLGDAGGASVSLFCATVDVTALAGAVGTKGEGWFFSTGVLGATVGGGAIGARTTETEEPWATESCEVGSGAATGAGVLLAAVVCFADCGGATVIGEGVLVTETFPGSAAVDGSAARLGCAETLLRELEPPAVGPNVPGGGPAAAGTLPVPGTPRVGKTVPSSRLPRLGCAAVGRDDVLAVVEAPLSGD